MHLHDLLRAWRAEIVGNNPTVAVADGEDRGFPAAVLVDRDRFTIPARLRRDERETLKASLVPARHAPGRPGDDDLLDELEAGLDIALPRPLELLIRLHDGGDFYVPDVPEIPDVESRGLSLLTVTEMVAAYQEIVGGVRDALEEMDPDDSDIERVAGRFGARGDSRDALVAELDAVHAGANTGLGIIPLVRAPGSRNYITYVPHAGRGGRVGFAFSDAGYLPEDTMEYAFEGLEGWLLAILKSHACRRIVLT